MNCVLTGLSENATTLGECGPEFVYFMEDNKQKNRIKKEPSFQGFFPK